MGLVLGILLVLSVIGNLLCLKQNDQIKEVLTHTQQTLEETEKEKLNIEKESKNKDSKISEQDKTIENKDKEISGLKNKNEQLESKIKELRRSTTLSKGFKHKAKFVSTFYSPYENVTGMEHDGDASATATGRLPGPTVFAVDPNIIPLNSKMQVTYPNGKVVTGVAGDTGGLIKGYKIDTFVYTHAEAEKRGIENVIIEW